MITSRKSRISSAAFGRAILEAAGLGALAVIAGCGGNVVVDEGTGDTTSTRTDTGTDTNTTTTSTTTNTITCSTQALTYSAMMQCSSYSVTSGCPAMNDPNLFADLYNLLQDQGCGGGDIASVLCGPEVGDSGQCCYEIDAIVYECGGRPFVVGGEARTAEVAARSDWLVSAAEAPCDLDEATRASLAVAWTRSALDEHASIASFARFVLELLAVGAPAEIVALAQRALAEEVKHAELCFGLASRYAGRGIGPSPLAISGSTEVRSDLASIAAATVREGCVGETIAAFVASAARAEAEDAAVQQALSVIAHDESSHAALAFRFVAWALKHGGSEVRDAIEAAVAASIATPPIPVPDAEGDPAVLRAHGQLSAATRGALAAQCIAEVIAPSLRSMLHEIRAAAGDPSHAASA